jgi:hypothetical protein
MLERGGRYYPVLVNYTSVDQILNQINASIDEAG